MVALATHCSRECDHDSRLKRLLYPPKRLVLLEFNPPRSFLGEVFRLLATGADASPHINTLSGLARSGLGANHPHSTPRSNEHCLI